MSRAAACSVCEVHAESTFRIDGMDCHEEVAILERRLKNLSGLEALNADVLGQRLLVKYDAARLTSSAIADAVADTGMRAWLEHEVPRATDASRTRLPLLVASGVALGLGLLVQYTPLPPWLSVVLFAASVPAAGLHSARRAIAAVRSRHLDINVLMAIAVAGAIVLGEWSEAAAVVFLFGLAQFLESRTMDRARNAIRALMSLAPQEALIAVAGGERRVPVADVRIGDVFRVRPGDKVPLDGTVVAGGSEVNQAPITGESLPVDKHPGDEVFAGSINGRGSLEVRATRLHRDTTLAKTIHLVERAQAQRAPAQAFVERFARVYTPAVLVLAAAIAAVPPLVSDASASAWMYRALVLLVIACPCALVISTPVSIVSALSAAARRGVLIKGGLHLERAGAVRCIAFDKTGTLTHGEPVVDGVETFNGVPRHRVLAIAAAVEARSEHPIARAIVARARAEQLPGLATAGFRSLPGLGGEAAVDGGSAVIGNERLFRERMLLSVEIRDRLAPLAASGRTAVLVAWNGVTIGAIVLSDRTRDSARDVVDLLREHGVRQVAMLTGDSAGAAKSIASAVGITDVRADLLPQDKVTAVAALRKAHRVVAMVGDGVNDAPALAVADVGIVMGAAGSDAALETADIALMGDDLAKIPYTIRLSRSALFNIKTNIAISILLKAIFLVLAVGGYATLWMAIAADTGASLLVVANALRLLKE
jgi:Cd2+/Zn2+-exporting ATPase